jgi:hypothetical protein
MENLLFAPGSWRGCLGSGANGKENLLAEIIQTSDDPAASPQGEHDQRDHEHTGHILRVAILRLVCPTHKDTWPVYIP